MYVWLSSMHTLAAPKHYFTHHPLHCYSSVYNEKQIDFYRDPIAFALIRCFHFCFFLCFCKMSRNKKKKTKYIILTYFFQCNLQMVSLNWERQKYANSFLFFGFSVNNLTLNIQLRFDI